MNYTYLLINFFTLIIPLIYSFHPKINFYKKWGSFIPAVTFTAAIFIIWDAYFTKIGVWGFNADYLTDIVVFGLPIEEVLFFFCIPYACVFTYHCLTTFYSLQWNPKSERIFVIFFSILLFVFGFFYLENYYTSFTFISLAILCLLLMFVAKVNWLGSAITVYGILLLPFLIVNGILTGTGLENPIVWYNENEFMGWRILTIPIEDIFYGFELILLNLFLMEIFGKRKTYLNK